MARWPARAAAAGMAALLAAALTAPQVAVAHASLVKTAPDDRAVVSAPRKAVALTFNEEMQARYARVAVTGPDGEKVNDGGPAVDGKVIKQPITPLESAGRYRVGWRAVSTDGHPVSGSFSFRATADAVRATESATSPAATPSSATATAARKVSSQDEGSFLERHAVHIALGALVMAVGVAVVIWERRRRHD